MLSSTMVIKASDLREGDIIQSVHWFNNVKVLGFNIFAGEVTATVEEWTGLADVRIYDANKALTVVREYATL